MRRIVVAAAALASLALAACGGDAAGPSFPDATGHYTTSYAVTLKDPSTNLAVQVACTGTFDVSEQSGADFSGTFTMHAPCDELSGAIDGTVETGGALRFTLSAPGQGQNVSMLLDGCSYVSGDHEFNGLLGAGELRATATTTIDCIDSDGVFRFDTDFRVTGTSS